MNICVCTASAAFWEPQARAFAAAFQTYGHSVEVLTDQTPKLYAAQFDLLFCIGAADSLGSVIQGVSSRFRIIYVIESIPTLTESDRFTQTKLNILLKNGVLDFDYVFVHSSRSIPLFKKLGVSRIEAAVWPHFPSIYSPPTNTQKKWDVLFLGTFSPYRKQVLDKIAKYYTVAVPQGAFHSQCSALFSAAKIVLNIHFTPLPNLECRVPEVLGSRGFLMTEKLDPDNIFINGKHLVTFDNDNALDLINHYIHADDMRNAIAEQGYREVQKYSVDRFIKRVLDVTSKLSA